MIATPLAATPGLAKTTLDGWNSVVAGVNSSFAGRRVGGALDEVQVGRGTPDDASVTTQASPYDQSTALAASSHFPRSQSTVPRSSEPGGDERPALGVGSSAGFFHGRRDGGGEGLRPSETLSGIASSFRRSNATFCKYSPVRQASAKFSLSSSLFNRPRLVSRVGY